MFDSLKSGLKGIFVGIRYPQLDVFVTNISNFGMWIQEKFGDEVDMNDFEEIKNYAKEKFEEIEKKLEELSKEEETIKIELENTKDERVKKKLEEELEKLEEKEKALIFNAIADVFLKFGKIAGKYIKASKYKEKLKIANIDESVLKKYPHELSGGQRQRVAIGMALLADPEVVIADEPTTGLDVVTQYQILNRLKQIQEDLGITLLLITHDVSVVATLSTDVLVLYAGKVLEYGKTKRVFKHSKHPYTYLLLKSYPDIGKEKLYEIPGSPPDLRNPPSGCVFHPRCPYATDICREKIQRLGKLGRDTFLHVTMQSLFVKEVETQ